VQDKAVVKFRELSADERTRDLYERREKARRDQAAREKWAFKQGMLEVVRNLLTAGDSVDKIITVTGLTHDEIEGLHHTG